VTDSGTDLDRLGGNGAEAAQGQHGAGNELLDAVFMGLSPLLVVLKHAR
jgi:hypothetical protein